ncbi:MAG: cytochrome ubiquinol oxidase subunit I [Lentisphaeria bacterium]|nr:cytochrome ubiquinol oxidase subunit I [Candidatus Neomarinimicrobiota bacterium]MCF7843137.1 cytochrome ubiquinol oxidase subunit I [Lentisphaeria bacterium]
MDALLLARLQFAITTVYHFFFVPLTLGLSIMLAIMETIYVRTGDEKYKRMVKFWGKLFLINFAMGVVTGIVQEFQFGMNWSEYSRFVGDIFGAPLAIEALLAFFLESTFLGLWLFGWDKLSKRVHAFTMWMVAIGANISALWILIANSFMQEPVGYVLRNGRAEMNDFFALLTNPHVWAQFPHVFFSGITTAAMFVVGTSAFHLLRKSPDKAVWHSSFRFSMIYGLIGIVLVIMQGHTQAQHMVKNQPMKLAAAEALWDSEDPAAMSLFTWGDEKNRRDVFAIRMPALLSILAYNRPSGMVKGINDLQAEYERTYGPGDYVPPVAITYWTFRMMVGAGMVLLVLILLGILYIIKENYPKKIWFMKLLPWAIALPYIANSTGWIMAEVGRQPWIVFGLQKTVDAVSPAVSTGEVLFSLIIFTLLYGILMGADIYLLKKFAIAGTVLDKPQPDSETIPDGLGVEL